ncbi:MAG: 50S ribosomal protein L25 [bacterium]
MSENSFTVAVQERNTFGTSAARRLRREGLVPLVVYSQGQEPESLALTSVEAQRLSHHTGMVELKIEGQSSATNAIVRDVQVHPLTQHILHMDCLGVRADEEISINVPIEPHGEAAGVHEGGILNQLHYELEITCLPGKVPESIVVNVEALNMGDSLAIADLPKISGIEYVGDPEETVFVVSAPTEEPSEEELEEGAELEGAEPELIGGAAESEDGESEEK